MGMDFVPLRVRCQSLDEFGYSLSKGTTLLNAPPYPEGGQRHPDQGRSGARGERSEPCEALALRAHEAIVARRTREGDPLGIPRLDPRRCGAPSAGALSRADPIFQ